MRRSARISGTKHQMYTEGPFTPPGLERTMVTFPSTLGGGNWNGLAYDPARRLVFTNVMNIGQVARMEFGKDRRSGQEGYRRVSPWGGPVGRFWNPENKIPCSAPPFGELVAVHVDTGEIAWKVPIGQRRRAARQRLHHDRRAQHRRGDRHRQRRALHRRHQRRPLPRLRLGHRQAALGDAARGQRALDPVHLSRQGRPPVRGRRRRRRQLPRLAQRYRIVAFALPEAH